MNNHVKVLVRNYLIIYLTITNACRSGNIENLKATQINAEDARQFVIMNGEHFSPIEVGNILFWNSRLDRYSY